jgi:phosphoenolpyruvate synthase/pyruvate phosphate dikinase
MDDGYYKKKMERWEKLCKEMEEWFYLLEKTELKKLSDKELYEIYNKFEDKYLEWWGFGQVAENIGYYGEEKLKIVLDEKQYKQYFNILVTPTKPSFTNEQEHHLFKIVKEVKANGFSEKAKSLLEEHSKKFHWIQNNFHDTKRLNQKYFTEEVKKFLKGNIDVNKLESEQKSRLVDIKKKKNELMDKLDFDKRLRKIVELIDEFCYFQDVRKKYVLITCRYIDLFTIEFSRRFNVDYKIMRWITTDMARELLKTGKVDVKKLKEIGKCSFFIHNEDGEDEIFTGKEALEKKMRIFSLEMSETLRVSEHAQEPKVLDESDINEIEGIPANQGRAEGYVRILLSPKEIEKMKQGEILVTTMTSPDFVPAMKKAAAVITDEGGVTSHASIISRELGIPCIIGTKVATKVLKTGDFVEVRANHGLVKILKK